MCQCRIPFVNRNNRNGAENWLLDGLPSVLSYVCGGPGCCRGRKEILHRSTAERFRNHQCVPSYVDWAFE